MEPHPSQRGGKRKKEQSKKEKLRDEEKLAAQDIAGSMLDLAVDGMCVQHDCGYSTACPGWWCVKMREKISLEEQIDQAIKLIESLSVKEPDQQPEGWRDKLEEVRRARTTSGTVHLTSQEQKEETIPDGRKILRPARLKTRKQPEGWRDELEEVRRARTTSGTIHHTSQEQKEETIPDGRKNMTRREKPGWRRGKLEEVRRARTTSGTLHHKPQEEKETIPEGRNIIPKEKICLKVPDKAEINIITIGSSRSPVKELINNFENFKQSQDTHETSKSKDEKIQTWKVKKLAESFSQTSGNESSSEHPAIRNSQVDGKQVPGNQVNPRDALIKPASSRKVWTKLRSGLFGWKYTKSVSVPPKPSHGKTSKIFTQNKPNNFEVRSVAQNSEILPPKITLGGRESSKIMKTSFGNNSNGEGLNLSAEKLSSVLRSEGQNDGHLGTKKIGGEI